MTWSLLELLIVAKKQVWGKNSSYIVLYLFTNFLELFHLSEPYIGTQMVVGNSKVGFRVTSCQLSQWWSHHVEFHKIHFNLTKNTSATFTFVRNNLAS